MEKHAFLITAHNKIDQLKILLPLLDDARNDIYLHIDLKCEFNEKDLVSVIHHSNVYFLKNRYSITRCDENLSRVMVEFLKEASANFDYSYYHTLSGQDLVLVDMDTFHDFFNDKDRFGKNFVRYSANPGFNKYCYYAYPQVFKSLYLKFINTNYPRKFVQVFRHAFFRFCQLFHYDLFKKEFPGWKFGYGSCWWSLHRDFVCWFIGQDKLISYMLKMINGEEAIIQIALLNSPYYNSLSKEDEPYEHKRYIEWKGEKKGHPSILTKNSYQKMYESKCLFARKFDIAVDKDIVEMICSTIKRRIYQN